MITKFLATEASTYEEESFLVCGVACSEPASYLMFQRSLPIGSDEDWGIGIEYDDQINSGYDKIKLCFLGQYRLRVELTDPIGRNEKYSSFEIDLRISASEWNLLAMGLRKVFTGRDEILVIESS